MVQQSTRQLVTVPAIAREQASTAPASPDSQQSTDRLVTVPAVPTVGGGQETAPQAGLPNTNTTTQESANQSQQPITASDQVPAVRSSDTPTLPTNKPPEFFCSIDQELHTGDVLVRIEGCDHEFCRDSLKDYIRSKLDDHPPEVPLCPMCIAEKRPPNSLFHVSLHLTTI
jgi:hypothetical protein